MIWGHFYTLEKYVFADRLMQQFIDLLDERKVM